MTLGTFTSANMREFDEYRLGKSYRAGQSVVLSELYAEKVDSDADFNTVSWQAYRMVDGEPDFSQSVSVDGTFVMEEASQYFSHRAVRGTGGSRLSKPYCTRSRR